MKIKQAKSDNEKNNLDRLLWEVLWKPLGFQRDIRQSFELDKPQLELIAVDNETVIGGLVANWLTKDEIEIRHIAVKPKYQKLTIGTSLVKRLIESELKDNPVKVMIWARSTSIGFFSKLGFVLKGKYLEHKAFTKHGITFQQMFLVVR